MYLIMGGTQPDKRIISGCPKCGHYDLLDKPKSNKVVVKENARITKKWDEDRQQVQKWFPPLIGSNGRPMLVKDISNPKLKDEIIFCHCWQAYHSSFPDGKKCPFNCYDRETKTQYEIGKCPMRCGWHVHLYVRKGKYLPLIAIPLHSSRVVYCLLHYRNYFREYQTKKAYFELEQVGVNTSIQHKKD